MHQTYLKIFPVTTSLLRTDRLISTCRSPSHDTALANLDNLGIGALDADTNRLQRVDAASSTLIPFRYWTGRDFLEAIASRVFWTLT